MVHLLLQLRLKKRFERARVKILLQPLPALEVIFLTRLGLHRESGGANDIARLEHERQRVFVALRLQIGVAGLLESVGVRAVGRHAIVQASAAGREAFFLGVVLAEDQPHDSVLKVALEVGGGERRLGNHPAGRENTEVKVGTARVVGGGGQNVEVGGLGVAEAAAAVGVDPRQSYLYGAKL